MKHLSKLLVSLLIGALAVPAMAHGGFGHGGHGGYGGYGGYGGGFRGGYEFRQGWGNNWVAPVIGATILGGAVYAANRPVYVVQQQPILNAPHKALTTAVLTSSSTPMSRLVQCLGKSFRTIQTCSLKT